MEAGEKLYMTHLVGQRAMKQCSGTDEVALSISQSGPDCKASQGTLLTVSLGLRWHPEPSL